MRDWTDVIDVIYELLTLKTTTQGPDMLILQRPLLGPSDVNADVSRDVREERKVPLDISGG